MKVDLVFLCLKIATGFTTVLAAAFCVVWVDHLGLAAAQSRVQFKHKGPSFVLQPFFDTLKLLGKQSLVTSSVEKNLFRFAPATALLVALSLFVVIPIGDGASLKISGMPLDGFILAPDLDIGLLFLLAMVALIVFPVLAAGWSSGDSFSTIAAFRACSQYMSFYLVMVVSTFGVVLLSGSLRLVEVVNQQSGWWLTGIPHWNAFVQPIAACTFIISVFVITRRHAFGVGTGNEEFGAGMATEYSGLAFASFRLTNAIHLVTFSALIATLFFGGWTVPVITFPPGWTGAVISLVVFALKTAATALFLIAAGWVLPSPRCDQHLSLAWKVMLPLAALSMMATGLMSALGWM